MLKVTASAIASSLTNLFNRSLSLGQVPVDWKLSNITSVPKGGDLKLISNYRPIDLPTISTVQNSWTNCLQPADVSFTIQFSSLKSSV